MDPEQDGWPKAPAFRVLSRRRYCYEWVSLTKAPLDEIKQGIYFERLSEKTLRASRGRSAR
jgi:hypothetical protein